MSQSGFVLRIAPGREDRVPVALQSNELIIGWGEAEGLLDPDLSWEEFREIVRGTYYSGEPDFRRAGNAAGHLWRFIRDMEPRDLVVVPHGAEFYVAEVVGPATHCPVPADHGATYRRAVKWLNGGKPIARRLARSALIARMKMQGTCADATDLLDEIRECLDLAKEGQSPTFQADLQARLVTEVLAELHSGRIESFVFERVIRDVLQGLGAEEVEIVPRSQDKGADLLATFHVAGTFQLVVAVQAKHWQPEPPVSGGVVEQLIRGIEAESANLGMVVTSGSISDEAVQVADHYFEEKGIRIELLDGEQFAKLMVEHGIRTNSQSSASGGAPPGE